MGADQRDERRQAYARGRQPVDRQVRGRRDRVALPVATVRERDQDRPEQNRDHHRRAAEVHHERQRDEQEADDGVRRPMHVH